MKLYFDSLTTLKVIHAESPVVIFFGTYGSSGENMNGAFSLNTNTTYRWGTNNLTRSQIHETGKHLVSVL